MSITTKRMLSVRLSITCMLLVTMLLTPFTLQNPILNALKGIQKRSKSEPNKHAVEEQRNPILTIY